MLLVTRPILGLRRGEVRSSHLLGFRAWGFRVWGLGLGICELWSKLLKGGVYRGVYKGSIVEGSVIQQGVFRGILGVWTIAHVEICRGYMRTM